LKITISKIRLPSPRLPRESVYGGSIETIIAILRATLVTTRSFWGFYLMTKYICLVCRHEYDPEKGEPTQNIPPETPFSALPADWVCPVCGAGKNFFKEVRG
jgi:rubredoxin